MVAFLDDRDFFGFGDEWDRVFDVVPEFVGYTFVGGGMFRGVDLHTKVDKDSERHVRWVQIMCYNDPLLMVVDKESFDTCLLGQIFMDSYGNTVRRSKVDPRDFGWMKVMPQRVQTIDSTWWNSEEVGEKYKVGGEMALKESSGTRGLWSSFASARDSCLLRQRQNLYIWE